MAFSTSNIKTRNQGGGLRVTTGDWTGALGDSAGTITVQGGRVFACEVTPQDTGEAWERVMWTAAAGSAANTMAVTVYNFLPITTGRFIIWHA